MKFEIPEEVKRQNRELCEKYPFLIPRNAWSGMRITEAQDGGFWPGDPEAVPEYDYEYTALDDMPDGWRKAFGLDLCEELKQELLAAGGEQALNDYMIVQIKEKFGELRWYDNGCTERWFREILPKYEALSERTCIHCGKPAAFISAGWISPWCEECAQGIRDRMVPIDEWFAPEEEENEDRKLVDELLETESAVKELLGEKNGQSM
jgi:hypothetical protein